MYLLLVFLPLIGSITAGFFVCLCGSRGAPLISTACVATTAGLSMLAFYHVALVGIPVSLELAPWFFSELFDASWGFYFDSLTVVMLVVITSISTLVHLYSISYMGHDPHLPRFMSYLSIFTFFMIMLVTADNFLQMFFGWEGVGLASYLLINFWFTRLQANKASIKAMLMNRVGDFGLALGIMGIFSLTKTVDFTTVFACAPYLAEKEFVFFTVPVNALTCITILLFIGAVGKSAQLGLHTWLPDAMEGPTPVSALIHAATMVTAGVFMIARCSPLYEFAPSALSLVAIVGAMTCFFAGTTAMVQNDLKRVIAYSTASQLGYMVFACGLSQYSVGVFHLMNHAFFKALLFLSAGSVIHALSDEQDMRKMGGLVQLLPLTFAMMTIGSLALVGFPFLAGFYSKDVILEAAYAKYTLSGTFTYMFGVSCVLLTSYYSFRLLFMTFCTTTASPRRYFASIHDAPLVMAAPLLVLALGSIFVGYLGRDMLIGVGTDFWNNALFVLPKNTVLVESEYIPQLQKFVPVFATLLGAAVAYYLNVPGIWTSYRLVQIPIIRQWYTFLNRRWFVDKVYNDWISQTALNFGYTMSFKTLDKGCFEILGPRGIAHTFTNLARDMGRFQTGLVYHYAVVMLFGSIVAIALTSSWEMLQGILDPKYYVVFLAAFFLATPYVGEDKPAH